MIEILIELIADSLILGLAALATIFTVGIVWRVERELDTSYKLFAVAIAAFTLSEMLAIFQFESRPAVAFAILFFKLVFAACFLAGTVLMRDILRKLDGEKNPELLTPAEHNRPI